MVRDFFGAGGTSGTSKTGIADADSGAATAGAVGYAAILQAQSALDRNAVTSVLEIPLYPFYYIEAIAMFFFAAVLLYDAVYARLAAEQPAGGKA